MPAFMWSTSGGFMTESKVCGTGMHARHLQTWHRHNPTICQATAANQPSVKAATLQRTTKSSQQNDEKDSTQDHLDGVYNWYKQWYPLAAVQDYDTKAPHAEMLLGRKIVLWNDNEGKWRCFEDECPHRLVPLSEGKIDPASGNLMCGYHGWTFQGNGKLANVPQLRHKGEKAQQAVSANLRSCARVRPVEVRQGLIWVWGESGPGAQEESKQTALPISTFRENHGEDNVQPFFDMYIRDLPANFEVWTENMQDQSHVQFAHHGVAGKRGGDKDGFFEMTETERAPDHPKETGSAYRLRFNWTPNGSVVQNTELFFKPPCLTSFWTTEQPSSLYIYAVPLSANSTRLIINAIAPKSILPKQGGLKGGLIQTLKRLLPDYFRALGHLTLNKVNQGDIIFMTGQQRALGRTSSRPSRIKDYFLATEADGGTAVWNSWLQNEGGKGPIFSDPAFTEHLWWSGNGRLKREHVLDNFSQHTSKCKSCQKVLADVEKGQRLTKWLSLAAFLATAGLLGQGQQPWSIPCLLALAAIGAGTVANAKLAELHKRFHYEPWLQADLD